jgi:DNA polymerase-3 subunit beta
MKLTIERSHLLKSLQHVQSVVERRNTIPILSNLLIASNDGKLSLTATDMDIEVIDSTPSEVGQEGTATAPAHMLYDIVRKLPEGAQIELTSEDGSERLALRSGRSAFSLHCLPPVDFPAFSTGDLDHSFSSAAADLRRLIDKTRFAISTEETRYYLNGIHLHAVEKGERALRAVATDGHRLARVEVDLPAGAEGMPGIIVPRNAVTELRKLLDDAEGELQVALSDVKICFTIDGAVLSSKLIDGTFPDYQRVIPEGNDKVMVVHRPSFAEAVDRVSTIASDKSRAIKLVIEKGKLILSANSPDQASATEELAVDYEGESLSIGFNSRYVLEMTQQIEGDSLRFSMADSVSPTVVGDSGDVRALYVLMPMRV